MSSKPRAHLPHLRDHAGILAPFALYVVAVALLGDWLIDDAGISFAYARSFAQGHGFVAQPGHAPVEGFSNFLWVLALAPTFALHLFHPVLTPKLLGAVAVLGAFYRLHATLRSLTERDAPGTALLTLLAISPPVVVWTSSGLENGLTLLLVAALLDVLVRRPPHAPYATALLATLLAMSRPDGLVYGLTAIVVVGAEALLTEGDRARRGRDLAIVTAGFVVLTGAFFAYRLRTFGRMWPHTYEAKREYPGILDRAREILAAPHEVAARLTELSEAVGGALGPVLLAGVTLALIVLAVRRRLDARIGILVVVFLAAAAAFVFLERDWMREYRFATAAVALAWALVVLTLESLTRDRRLAFAVASGVAVLAAGADAVPRMLRFADAEPTPYRRVLAETELVGRYAAALHVEGGSILTADVGAELMASPLWVYDLAGLCEPEVLRTLKRGSPLWRYDHPEFFAWVFERAKPTFIVARAFWSNVASFAEDPRFVRDYASIDAYEDGYVARTYGRYARSGVFVRRDALPAPEALERLRSFGAPSESPGAPLLQLARKLGLRPPPANDAATLELGAATVHAEHVDEGGLPLAGRAQWLQIAARSRSEGNRIIEARARERLAAGERTYAEETLRRRRTSSVQLIDEGLHAYRVGDHATALARWGLIAPTDALWATAQNNRASSFIVLHEFASAEEALANARYANPKETQFERNKVWLDQERAKATARP